jgi:transcriptional regulator with XRE-family HTH domain
MSNSNLRHVGYSAIPPEGYLSELENDKRRDAFVADNVKLRLALLIRTLREQRGWSQAELGKHLGKPQSVISRLEDPDYGKLSLQTLFEVASAFKLPLFIDMPNWEDWFAWTTDMSVENLCRQAFDIKRLLILTRQAEDELALIESGANRTDLIYLGQVRPRPLVAADPNLTGDYIARVATDFAALAFDRDTAVVAKIDRNEAAPEQQAAQSAKIWLDQNSTPDRANNLPWRLNASDEELAVE